MDGRQFDRFTRELGAGRSRRSLVRGAAASIFGIGAFGRLRQEAGATAVICAGQDEECVSDGGEGLECCPGYICLIGENNSYCVPEESGCVGHYESCAGEECCEGYVCSSEQYCAIESPVCGTDWDACGYYEGDVLTTCCDGFECVNGGEGSYCQYVCSAEGMPCDYLLPAGERSEGGCCDGLICNGEGICVVPAQMAEEVAADAYEQEIREEFFHHKVINGASILGVYPPNAETLAEFEEWRKEMGK